MIGIDESNLEETLCALEQVRKMISIKRMREDVSRQPLISEEEIELCHKEAGETLLGMKRAKAWMAVNKLREETSKRPPIAEKEIEEEIALCRKNAR
ncbi:hypothetical protein FACS1894198_0760 [Clostridia bacterium]|nr:hypothetical protein FACS1894198_0760 [Clostridia bacterium]